MKVLVYILTAILMTNIALASDSADWDNLIQKINTNGEFNPADYDIPASYRLKDIKGGMDESHVANYVSEWGYVDRETGEFNPAFVSFVYEDWKLTENFEWAIEQWICISTVDGQLYDVSYTNLLEALDGKILGYESKKLDSDAPESIKKFAELIKSWQ